MFQSLLASLWSPLQHFFTGCVKTWRDTHGLQTATSQQFEIPPSDSRVC
jgi:hypothetical protein